MLGVYDGLPLATWVLVRATASNGLHVPKDPAPFPLQGPDYGWGWLWVPTKYMLNNTRKFIHMQGDSFSKRRRVWGQVTAGTWLPTGEYSRPRTLINWLNDSFRFHHTPIFRSANLNPFSHHIWKNFCCQEKGNLDVNISLNKTAIRWAKGVKEFVKCLGVRRIFPTTEKLHKTRSDLRKEKSRQSCRKIGA